MVGYIFPDLTSFINLRTRSVNQVMNDIVCLGYFIFNRMKETGFEPRLRDCREIHERRRLDGIGHSVSQRRYEDLAEKCRNILDLFQPDRPQKVPSLLDLAATQVVICLCSQKGVHHLIRQRWLSLRNSTNEMCSTEYCKIIQGIVISNLRELKLPSNVKRNALNIVGPVCAEIIFWIDFHYDLFFSKFPESFCWTSKGKIDFVKTASQLLTDSSYTRCEQFSLASIYCFKTEIEKFWSQDNHFLADRNLITFWKYLLSGRLYTFAPQAVGQSTPSEWGFAYAITCASESAVKYFADRLPKERKSAVILFFLQYVIEFQILHSPELFLYLFPLMNKNDQIRWLDLNPSTRIINCFLRWPWLEYFIPLAKIFLSSCCEKTYLMLMIDISARIYEFPNCQSYKRVFKDFWCISSVEFKAYIMNQCIYGLLLSVLFQNGNEYGALLILEDFTTQQRCDAILSLGGKQSCYHLIIKANWKALEMLIVKCITCEDFFLTFQRQLSDVLEENAASKKDLNHFYLFCAHIRKKHFSTCEE